MSEVPQLQLNSDQLLEVLSFSRHATAIYTTDEIIIEMANDAMLAFWGKDRNIIGLPLEMAVPELTGQPFKRMLQEVLKTGITDAGTVPAQTRVDGQLQTAYYEYEYRAVVDENGQPYCILHTAADVTAQVTGKEAVEALNREQLLNEELATANEELLTANEELAAANDELISINEQLKQTQLALHNLNSELEHRVLRRTRDLAESEARFRGMAEGSGILIAMGDESGNATYFSKAWTELTGRPTEQLMVFGWIDMIHAEDKDRYVSTYLNAFKRHAGYKAECRIEAKDQQYRWLLINGTPRFRSDGSFAGYISSCVDITEQKELEKRKDDFISIASHELKTPITSLKASLQLIDKLKADPSNQMVPKLIFQARKSVQRVSILVDDLLNVSKLQQTEIQLNKSTFIVSQLLNSCCNPVSLMGKHQIEITGDLALQVYADEHRIDQVVTNLINNAVKYAPDSDRILLNISREGEMVRISLTDFGPGIPKEKQAHLFDRYFRVDSSGQHVSGLGLGLYISAEIVERHGGQMGVESEMGRGSAFWLTLPQFGNK